MVKHQEAIDSDHAGYNWNHRSKSGFLIYTKSAMVMWLSKKQVMIKFSVFGTNYVAMKVGIETFKAFITS